MSVNCRWCVIRNRAGPDMLCDECRAAEVHERTWKGKGWTVGIEYNDARDPGENWTCEVSETVTGEPLLSGYLCGYGMTRADAVNDAARKMLSEPTYN